LEESKMSLNFRSFMIGALALTGAGLIATSFVPRAHADQWNKMTIVTVNQPIIAGSKVLDPGTYVWKLMDSPSDRHIVQIYDKDQQHLEETILAVPNYRLQPTGRTQFGFWETPAGQPKALRSWFYPGDNFGQEFAYPKGEAMQIAAATNQPVPTTYAQNEAELTTARVGTVDKVGTERELPQQTPPATTTMAKKTEPAVPAATTPQPTEPEPAATPQPNTAERAATPQATPQATTLPHTASPYPLFGMIGLLALAGYGAMTVLAKRAS
jgi:hypothetical protein